MIQVLLAPIPVLITMLMIVVAVMPWGGPAWTETALALLPASCIYFWSRRRPQLIPAVVVFGCGLVLDVLTHGPLGVWACAALAVALAGRMARRVRPPLGWSKSAISAAGSLALAATLVAVLEAAFAWRAIPIVQQAQALAAACLAYPVLAGLLSLLDPLWPVADSRSLFARGD